MAWEQIDESTGLWTSEYRVPLMKARSSAVRLPSGGFLVHSPGTGLEAEFSERVGVAEALLLPNSYHHLGVSAWRHAFPQAIAIASPDAQPRLAKRGHTDLGGLDALEELIPAHVAVLEPEGTKVGEVWLSVRTPSGVAWLVGDAFFNMKSARRFRTRVFQRLVKSAPGLAMSQLMKWGGLRDRKAFKAWVLSRLDRDAPNRFVPLHGDLLESDDFAAQLRELLERRL